MKRKKWLRALILLTLFATVGFALESVAAQNRNAPRSYLNSTASFVKAWAGTLDRTHMTDALPMNHHIQELVFRYVEDYVAGKEDSPAPSPVELRRDLEISVFGELKWPFEAMVRTFAHPWKGGHLLGVGYSLRWTDQNRFNGIGLFLIQEGKISRVASANFVPGTDLTFDILPARNPDQLLLLVSGIRKGKSHPRLSLMLYSFEGDALKPQWERQDIYGGKFRVDEGNLWITYLKEEEFIRETRYGRFPPRYEALYSPQGSGFSLESDEVVSTP